MGLPYENLYFCNIFSIYSIKKVLLKKEKIKLILLILILWGKICYKVSVEFLTKMRLLINRL